MSYHDAARFEVLEVHNFGGFFGGDTVTLDAAPLDAPDDLTPLVIDERALENIPDRHKVAPGMVFALTMDGDRVDHAVLLAAPSHAELRAALGDPVIDGPLAEPLVLSARCPRCERWVVGDLSADEVCHLCAEQAV